MTFDSSARGGKKTQSRQPNMNRAAPPPPKPLAVTRKRPAPRATRGSRVAVGDAHRALPRPGPGRVGWLPQPAAEPFWTAPAHPNRRRRRRSGLGHGEAAHGPERRGSVIPSFPPLPLSSLARTPRPPPTPPPPRARPSARSPGRNPHARSPSTHSRIPAPSPAPAAELRHARLASPPAAPAAPVPRWTE